MRSYTKAAAVLILTAGSGLGLAACGSGSSGPAAVSAPAASSAPAAAATAPSVNYGQQYLADVEPEDAAAKAVTASDTITSPAVLVLGTAAAGAARELLTHPWPANAQADVHALALDTEKVNTDIENQDVTSLQADVETTAAQAQVVRADLGLPAAASAPGSTPATPKYTVAAKPESAPSLAMIGQPVRADVFTFTVTKFECGLKILGQPGNGSDGNGPGGLSVPLNGQFCAAVVSERNDSSQPQAVPFDAQITGTNGSTYDYDSDPVVLTNAQIEYLGSNYSVQSDINPGTTYMDVFSWDVPAGVRAASVTIDSSTGTGSGTVNVRS